LSEYIVYVAAASQGFNEWRANIILRTTEQGTYCDLRFVDDPATVALPVTVRETGPSLVYLPFAYYGDFLRYLQTEGPLRVVLYGAPSNRVIVQTGHEPPGERET